MSQRTLVTGGAGFIGGCFIRQLMGLDHRSIVCVDKLTYAGRRDALPDDESCFRLLKADICQRPLMEEFVHDFRLQRIGHFAAESHVDRSIESPLTFVQTNVRGDCTFFHAAGAYWGVLPSSERSAFRVLHVSTDEVYDSLGPDSYFTEATAYDPKSPHSASIASSDHFARAWFHSYGLPVVVTNCSKNYGPFQHPEKLIPLMTTNAIQSTPVCRTIVPILSKQFVASHNCSPTTQTL